VHRDIKPSNFLIDKQGYLKICDYGLAKFLKKGERTKTLLGTVPYLSPELVQEDYYDHSVDLWSLGVSCYEMAYGVTPFEPKGLLDDKAWSAGVKANIKSGQCRLPADRGVNLPARLFMKNMLTKELSSRLGGDLNYSAVKSHQFFATIDWPGIQMRTEKPPPVGQPLPSASRMG
jgi:serine/threonine protein kinase